MAKVKTEPANPHADELAQVQDVFVKKGTAVVPDTTHHTLLDPPKKRPAK